MKICCNEMHRYACESGYDCDAAPIVFSFVQFGDRVHDGTQDHQAHRNSMYQQGFPADDSANIEHVMAVAKQADVLRKAIQQWYKDTHGKVCGVTARRKELLDVEFCPVEFARAKIFELIQDEKLRKMFLDALDDPNSDDETLHFKMSLLNGSFYFKSQSSTVNPFVKEFWEFQLPSSKEKGFRFNRDCWNDLLAKGLAKGHKRLDLLTRFLVVYAGYDGSVVEKSFEAIVSDEVEILRLFCGIFKELHQGVPFHIYLQDQAKVQEAQRQGHSMFASVDPKEALQRPRRTA